MINQTWARQFAEEWIDSWNSHDLERILTRYSDDFVMTSPLIVQRMKNPSGRLSGKDAIRPYWQIGLDAVPPLKFELLDVLVSISSIIIYYHSISDRLAAEVLMLNDKGQVVEAIAHYS